MSNDLFINHISPHYAQGRTPEVTAVIGAIKTVLSNQPDPITNPREFLNILQRIMAVHSDAIKAKILIDSGLIMHLGKSILKLPDNTLFTHPLMREAFRNNTALGTAFLQTEFNNNTEPFRATVLALVWLRLIKLKALSVTQTIDSNLPSSPLGYGVTERRKKNFMTHWYGLVDKQHVDSVGDLYLIEGLFNENAFQHLDTATQGALLSLPDDAGQTALQRLAVDYLAKFRNPATVIGSMIAILEKGVTVSAEQGDSWLEITANFVAEYDYAHSSWKQLIEKIPSAMFNEYYQKGLHIKLAAQLVRDLSQMGGEYFMNRAQEHDRINKFLIFSKLIEKITVNQSNTPTVTSDVLKEFEAYRKIRAAYYTFWNADSSQAFPLDAFRDSITAIENDTIAVEKSQDLFTLMYLFSREEVIPFMQSTAIYKAIQRNGSLERTCIVSPILTTAFSQCVNQLYSSTASYYAGLWGASNKGLDYVSGNTANSALINNITGIYKKEQPSTLKAMKMLVYSIQFRICSFTAPKFEEYLYAQKLLPVLQGITPEMSNILAQHKTFFIAAVNLSLQKISLEDYKNSPEKAEALKNTLDLFFNKLGFSEDDLGEYAQAIYKNLLTIVPAQRSLVVNKKNATMASSSSSLPSQDNNKDFELMVKKKTS